MTSKGNGKSSSRRAVATSSSGVGGGWKHEIGGELFCLIMTLHTLCIYLPYLSVIC